MEERGEEGRPRLLSPLPFSPATPPAPDSTSPAPERALCLIMARAGSLECRGGGRGERESRESHPGFLAAARKTRVEGAARASLALSSRGLGQQQRTALDQGRTDRPKPCGPGTPGVGAGCGDRGQRASSAARACPRSLSLVPSLPRRRCPSLALREPVSAALAFDRPPQLDHNCRRASERLLRADSVPSRRRWDGRSRGRRPSRSPHPPLSLPSLAVSRSSLPQKNPPHTTTKQTARPSRSPAAPSRRSASTPS